MSDYSTPLGSIAVGQGDQATKANGLFNATSPAALYGLKYATTTGLTLGYHGGHPTLSNLTIGTIADGTLTLTASTTNYVTAPKSSGIAATSTATTNWNDTANYWRLYSITTNTTSITGYTDYREIGKMTGVGVGLVAPVTKTTSFTLAENENEVICNGSASITVTLPTASSCVGRVVRIKTRAAYTVISASSNVKPIGSDTAGTAILPATSGVWAELVSDGTNWVIMSQGVSSSGAAITVKDEGSNLTTSLASLDFVGEGVSATTSGDNVTVTITGSAGGRELLSAARTYYVRTDGSDSNNGLSNSSGGAFLTIQKAINVASAVDNGGYDVTIRVVAGTYTSALTAKTIIGAGRIIIRGDTADLTSTIISTTSTACFSNAVGFYGTYHFEYLKLQTTTSGDCLYLVGSGAVTYQNIAFGACAGTHIIIGVGCISQATGNYTINGNAVGHIGAYDAGQIRVQSVTVTLTGTPAFSGQFAAAGRCGTMLANSVTFSGSATGKRYDVSLNAVMFTSGGGANYFPGNSAGTTATGGQYV